MIICITKAKQLFSCFLILIMLLSGIFAYASVKSGTDDKEIAVPILMYHSILKDPKRSGDYVVTPDTLENDMKYLRHRHFYDNSHLLFEKNHSYLPDTSCIPKVSQSHAAAIPLDVFY